MRWKGGVTRLAVRSNALERLQTLDLTEIVLGWQGFDETERQVRWTFQQRYINEEQSWHTLADAVLANGSLAHPRDHTKAVAQRHAQDSR